VLPVRNGPRSAPTASAEGSFQPALRALLSQRGGQQQISPRLQSSRTPGPLRAEVHQVVEPPNQEKRAGSRPDPGEGLRPTVLRTGAGCGEASRTLKHPAEGRCLCSAERPADAGGDGGRVVRRRVAGQAVRSTIAAVDARVALANGPSVTCVPQPSRHPCEGAMSPPISAATRSRPRSDWRERAPYRRRPLGGHRRPRSCDGA
jgi:hypothetical protein